MTTNSAVLKGALFDNPFTDRDGGLRVSRGTAVVVSLVVVGLWAFIALTANMEGDLQALAIWHEWNPSGRALAAVGAGLFAALAALAATMLGASAVVEEKERGTWRELALLPTPPEVLVVGKWLAVVQSLVPIVVLSAPLLALGAITGDVSVLDVALLLLFIVVHVPVFAALGIALSMLSSQLRQATALAVGVFLVGGGPVLGVSFTVLAQWTELGVGARWAPLAVTHTAALVALAPLFLLVARERLAPRGLEGGPLSRAAPLLAVVVVPLLGASLLALAAGAGRGASLLETGAASVLGVELAVLVIAVVASDVAAALRPLRVLVVDGAVALVALVGASALSAGAVFPSDDGAAWPLAARALLGLGAASPVVVAGLLAGAVGAALGAWRGKRTVAVVAALFVAFVLVAVTALAIDVSDVLGGPSPVAALNPLYAAFMWGAHVRFTVWGASGMLAPADPGTVIAVVVAQAIAALVLATIAGRHRRA